MGDHGLEALLPEIGSLQPNLLAYASIDVGIVEGRKKLSICGHELRAEIEPQVIRGHVGEHLIPLLTRLIKTIDDPLVEFLQRSRRSPGAKGKEQRRFLIHHATNIYTEATGREPTETKSEPFAMFCERLMELVGLPLRGLHAAIRYELGKALAK